MTKLRYSSAHRGTLKEANTRRSFHGSLEAVQGGYRTIRGGETSATIGRGRTEPVYYGGSITEDANKVTQRQKNANELKARLERLSRFNDNWDGAGAPAPSRLAIRNATSLVDYFRTPNFFPDKVAASVEGGIGFTFISPEKRAYIECSNDGELFAVIYGAGAEPEIWDFTLRSHSSTRTLERIRQALDG